VDLFAEFVGATPRSKALAKLGILKLQDSFDINSLFKKSPWWQKASITTDALVKSEHKRKIANAKMKYIRDTTLKSQTKGGISGDPGEVERLLTVLYYESNAKRKSDAKRDPTDHVSDESD
jgi:hypothetical protein